MFIFVHKYPADAVALDGYKPMCLLSPISGRTGCTLSYSFMGSSYMELVHLPASEMHCEFAFLNACDVRFSRSTFTGFPNVPDQIFSTCELEQLHHVGKAVSSSCSRARDCSSISVPYHQAFNKHTESSHLSELGILYIPPAVPSQYIHPKMQAAEG